MKRLSLTLFIAGFIAATAIFILMGFGENDHVPGKKTVNNQARQNSWYPVPLPSSINFAGEAVPLNRWEVKEQPDRELLFNYYWQDNILYMMKLSARFFPAIEQTLKSNGIPDDFKYLCVAESNMLNVTSRVGAAGFWQLMKGTAPGYDIEISETVDERYNVTRSTEAACKYIKQAYDRFGSWTAAAASYNCGMAGYAGHASYQSSNNYYDLVLPEETQRYIFRILAFKHLLENADSLGFKLDDHDLYGPIKTRPVTVNHDITSLAEFARQNQSSYKMLKWLNPWLRGRSLKVKPGKTYQVQLPLETRDSTHN